MKTTIRSTWLVFFIVVSGLSSSGCESPAVESNTESAPTREANLPPPPPSAPTRQPSTATLEPAATEAGAPVASAMDVQASAVEAPAQQNPRGAGGQHTAARPPAAQPAAPRQPAPSTSAPRSSSAQNENTPHVRLSAGLALAQSLPTGTAMGFSVDYNFASGSPDPSSKYFWVLQADKGGTVALPVELNRRGNLTQFIPQWKPQHGGFSCFLAEETQSGQRRAISDKETLK